MLCPIYASTHRQSTTRVPECWICITNHIPQCLHRDALLTTFPATNQSQYRQSVERCSSFCCERQEHSISSVDGWLLSHLDCLGSRRGYNQHGNCDLSRKLSSSWSYRTGQWMLLLPLLLETLQTFQTIQTFQRFKRFETFQTGPTSQTFQSGTTEELPPPSLKRLKRFKSLECFNLFKRFKAARRKSCRPRHRCGCCAASYVIRNP